MRKECDITRDGKKCGKPATFKVVWPDAGELHYCCTPCFADMVTKYELTAQRL